MSNMWLRQRRIHLKSRNSTHLMTCSTTKKWTTNHTATQMYYATARIQKKNKRSRYDWLECGTPLGCRRRGM